MTEQELIGRRTGSTETHRFREGAYAIDLEIGARYPEAEFFRYMRLARDHARRVLWKTARHPTGDEHE